jgi:hypothetical protein
LAASAHALSLLAVLCQVLATLLLPLSAMARTADATPPFADVICHAGGDTKPVRDEAPGQHPSDCALCPLCFAHAQPVLSPTPAVLPPLARRDEAAALPPMRDRSCVGVFRPVVQARAPPIFV